MSWLSWLARRVVKWLHHCHGSMPYRVTHNLIAVAGVCVLALGGGACQVTPPDVSGEIARATGVEGAILFAGEAPAVEVGEVLTLEAATRLALTHDYRLQAALARVRQAEAEANQARLLPNPILNIDVRFASGGTSDRAFEATLTGDLVSLLQKPGMIAAADKRLRKSAAEALVVALDVISEVQQAYVAAQLVDAQIDNAEKRTRILQQLRDIAGKRLNAGEGTRLDTLTIDARLIEAAMDLSDIRLARVQDRLALAKLIAQPRLGADWRLSAWQAPASGPMADEGAWLEAALRRRPEIHARLWELRALGDDLTAAEFSPFVGGEIGAHTERDPNWRTGPTITVPLPVFDWGQMSRAKLEAQRVEARHELAGQEAEVIEDLRLAYAADAHAREALAVVQEKLLPLERQLLDQAQAAYRGGEADLATLLLAETELQVAQNRIFDLQEKVTVARIKLQRAAGGAAVAGPLEMVAPASRPATGSGS